jgi:arylsulfatase A-like enzyme
VRTPHLDRLAQSGVSFRHAYTPIAICVPSRIAIMTGAYPHTNGVYTNNIKNGVRLPFLSMFEYLRRQCGYRTGITGKKHIGDWECSGLELERCDYTGYLKERGLLETYQAEVKNNIVDYLSAQSQISYADSEAVWVGTQTIEMIDELADEPFFIWCNPEPPHPPLLVSHDSPFTYDPDTISLPENRLDSTRQPDLLRAGVESIWNSEVSGEEKLRQALARYYSLISAVDDNVGRIIAHLEARGLMENTLVIFSSDHGDFAGEYGMIAKNALGPRECLHRVPLLCYWRGHFGLERAGGFVETIDLFPTLCDLLDIEIPPSVQGESFAAILRGSATASNPIFTGKDKVFFDGAFAKTIRNHRYRLTYQWDGSARGQLYDLQRDPHETLDVFDDPQYRAVRERLIHEILNWLIATEQPVGWNAESTRTPPSRWYRENPMLQRHRSDTLRLLERER